MGASVVFLVEDRVAVLRLGGGGDLSPQLVHHRLHPVANPQDRQPAVVDPGWGQGRSRLVHAGGPARENDPLGVQLLDGLPWRVGREYLAVDFALTDAASDQPAVLGAEIYHDHGLPLRLGGRPGGLFLDRDLQIGRYLQIAAGDHSVGCAGVRFLRHM